jgi:hydroxyacylglutathione hydrolase
VGQNFFTSLNVGQTTQKSIFRKGQDLLNIYTIPVTPFAQNARVLHDSSTGSAAIVDPGGDIDQIWEVVEQLQPGELSIFLTHAHIDHAGGVAACLERAKGKFKSKVPLIAHTDPLLRQSVSRQAKLYGLPESQYRDVPEPDQLLDDRGSFSVGSYSSLVLWTPGHAPDHLSAFFDIDRCLLHEGGSTYEANTPVLIAGDALFAGSIGRTDLPGGSLQLLLRSIREKLLILPEETLVLSGHGPITTIGQEKRTNPFLQN